MAEENVKRSVFEANAALNAQEFANRQILLKGNGVPNSQAPFGANYIDQSTNPPKVYRQMGLGVGVNWQSEQLGGTSINGAVFITDIAPQNQLHNVGQKIYSSDGNVLDEAVSNTELIKVSVVAAMGHSRYKPEVRVNGGVVDLVQDNEYLIWRGIIDIDIEGRGEVVAVHEDGATHLVRVQQDIGPEVIAATIIGGYPDNQTELKEGDQIQLEVEANSEMVRIEVENFGAAQAEVFDFAATENKVIAVTIADRGNVSQEFGIRLRAMNSNGSFGGIFESSSQGSDDGVYVVFLNNLHPSGIIDAIEYPVDQLAIKDNEEAQVGLSASNYDGIQYSSPNGELEIPNADTFEAYKSVSRIEGDYNISNTNIRVQLKRSANGAITVADGVVQIAHREPTVTIIEPANRLRSGGNFGTQLQNHEIKLISDQELIEVPVISVPHGTLENSMVNPSGDKTEWTQNLRVHDDDEKGIFQFSLTKAKNLAGKVINVLSGDNNYELGGFVSRTLVVPAFENEVDLGVKVSETSKVVARDKDNSLLTYKNNLDDQLKTYAITGPTETLNVKGDLFYWADVQAVNNNTTGLATITIEELV